MRGFIQKSSRLTLTVMALLVFLVLSALVLLMVQAAKTPPKHRSVKLPESATELPMQTFFMPQSEGLTEDYYFSRESRALWPQEEIERWFTEPSEETVSALGKSNDKLVEAIIGAAP